MKKRIIAALSVLLAALLLFMTGCGGKKEAADTSPETTKQGADSVEQGNKDESSTGSAVKLGGFYDDMNVRSDVALAIKASRLLGGMIHAGESLICSSDPQVAEKAKLHCRENLSLLKNDWFVTEEGKIFLEKEEITSFYSTSDPGREQIPAEKIVEIAEGDNQIRLLSDSGKLYLYSGLLHALCLDSSSDDPAYSALSQTFTITDNIVFGKDGGVFDDHGHNLYSYYRISDKSMENIKNTVVGTGFVANDFSAGFTGKIAAITADGNVYAVGSNAEEIRSWGSLSYIAMSSVNDTVTVGLKPDGTLVFTSDSPSWYASAYESQVVPALDGKIIGLSFRGQKDLALVTDKGTVFLMRFVAEEVVKYSETECSLTDGLVRYDKSGNAFELVDGRFVPAGNG